MKNKTAKITMMNRTAGLIFGEDEGADVLWKVTVNGGENADDDDGDDGGEDGIDCWYPINPSAL